MKPPKTFSGSLTFSECGGVSEALGYFLTENFGQHKDINRFLAHKKYEKQPQLGLLNLKFFRTFFVKVENSIPFSFLGS